MTIQVRVHTDPPISAQAMNIVMVGDITQVECLRLPECLALRYHALRNRRKLTLVSVPSVVFELHVSTLPGLLGQKDWAELRAVRSYAWNQRNTATLQAARTALLSQLMPAAAVVLRQQPPLRSTDRRQVLNYQEARRRRQSVISTLREHNPKLCVIELDTAGHPVHRSTTQPDGSRRTDRAHSS